MENKTLTKSDVINKKEEKIESWKQRFLFTSTIRESFIDNTIELLWKRIHKLIIKNEA